MLSRTYGKFSFIGNKHRDFFQFLSWLMKNTQSKLIESQTLELNLPQTFYGPRLMMTNI